MMYRVCICESSQTMEDDWTFINDIEGDLGEIVTALQVVYPEMVGINIMPLEYYEPQQFPTRKIQKGPMDDAPWSE
jgi:hypothetical protein